MKTAVVLVVALVVAYGAAVTRKVSVPNVVGVQQATAVKRLRAAHLRPYVIRVKSNEPVGSVVVQKPRAHAKVAQRTRVTISVSRGPGP